MHTKIQKWGNSQGLRLAKSLLEDARLGAMVEQVESVDFRSRQAKRIERASDELLAHVLSVLDACIY